MVKRILQVIELALAVILAFMLVILVIDLGLKFAGILSKWLAI